VVVSTFGALSGIVLSGPRVYLAMARDGLLFSWMGTIHPRFATPHVAIALQGVLAAVLAATGTYRALFSRVIYTEWLFFGLLALGIYRLRRRQAGNPAAFRLPLWVPAVFALAAFGVVANHFIVQPREALLGLSFLLLGAPVYGLWLWIRRRREAPP
jgi:APA family basic amino acid/polyamine antiporter